MKVKHGLLGVTDTGNPFQKSESDVNVALSATSANQTIAILTTI